MSTCWICLTGCDTVTEMTQHVINDHPDLWPQLDKWPDGSIVWVADPDTTTPERVIGDAA